MSDPKEIRFDDWVLRTDSGELIRAGQVTRLQDQPRQVLLELLARPGELVTRGQLIARLWPKGVVDYETGLNTVVRKLRLALGDDADEPRYIETIPRRGYRFIGTVEPASQPPTSIAEPDVEPVPVSERRLPHKVGVLLGAALLLLFVLVVTQRAPWRQDRPVAESMAVLPFKPLLPEAANPALELGMADTLITHLSRVPNLRVSPLSAARPYGAADQDPLAAGRALGVDAVLDGSLQVDSQRLRVSARLLRVSDGHALWSDNFDEPMTNLFQLQDAVARKVVTALAVKLSSEQARRLAHPATRSMTAYQHYVSGLYLWQRRLPEATQQFETALREDPAYAQAWAGLAGALAAQGVYGYAPPNDVFPRARQAALQAIALDPDLARARGALAHVLVQYDRRYQEGEREYLAALRLDPADATTWMRLALVRAMQGRLDDALADMTHARDLEPLTLSFATNVGLILYLKRDYARASEELERVLELDPGFDSARALFGRVLLAQGDADAAIREFSAQRMPVPGGEGDLGRAHARAGHVAQARAEIERLSRLATDGFGVAYDLAGIHAALGETALACAALRRAIDDHSQLVGFIASDPALDSLRGEACLATVQRQLLQRE